MEQLKRLFSFFKNLNLGNITFTKKQAIGNKLTIGLMSKYKKYRCFLGKCISFLIKLLAIEKDTI